MKGVAALVIGVATTVSFATVLAFFGGLDFAKAFVSLGVGALMAWFAGGFVFVETTPTRLRGVGFWGWVILTVWTLASLRAFLWLIYPVRDELRVLSPHNLGDMALHINFIRYFASGVSFWPPSPILVGEPLTYPAGMDIFNALLVLVGVDWRVGLIFVGLVGSLVVGWALYRYGGAFAVAAVLFGGGLAVFAIFKTGEFVEYGSDATWKNIFLAMIVTQRGFLYALPAGLVLLWAWRHELDGRRAVPLVVQGLLYGTMPLFHLHTFMFLSIALACAFALKRAHWQFWVLGIAFFPATFFVWLTTNGFRVVVKGFGSGEGMLSRLKLEVGKGPLWTVGDGGATGWLLEFGVAVGLALVAALFVSMSRRDVVSRWLIVVAFVVASIGFLFPLTDWEWDNTKLLVWAWIALLPVLWKYVLEPLTVWVRAPIFALLFFTGVVALMAGLDARHGYTLVKRSELAKWEPLVRNLPPEAVIACESKYNSPFLLLGRRVMCGYEGHLSSHGLNYERKFWALHQILNQAYLWEDMARELGVDYVAAEDKDGSRLIKVERQQD